MKTSSSMSGRLLRVRWVVLATQILKSSSTHACSLMMRRLRVRFVSAKRQFPADLSEVRTTLTVPRSQSMSCHFKREVFAGRMPVVSATQKPARSES